MHYFPEQYLKQNLDRFRGKIIKVFFRKSDKSLRVLEGMLCFTEKGEYLIDERAGLEMDPKFKRFKTNRVLQVEHAGINYFKGSNNKMENYEEESGDFELDKPMEVK